MTELAVFDLDYTLTRRGTWGRFIAASMSGRPLSFASLAFRTGLMQLRYKGGREPRVAVKATMMRHSISGWSRERLSALADEFVDRDLESGMNGPVVEALRHHQQQGHTVLIASAGVDLLVERYTKALQADGQVSTAFAWTDDGRLSEQFESENCYGPQKLVMVRDWINENDLTPSSITAYSDSRSDAPLLEAADKAIIVNPNVKTKAYAQDNGFEIWQC